MLLSKSRPSSLWTNRRAKQTILRHVTPLRLPCIRQGIVNRRDLQGHRSNFLAHSFQRLFLGSSHIDAI